MLKYAVAHRLIVFRVIAVVLINCVFALPGYAQSYGLGFYSHEVVQDKRTSLELNLDNITSKDALKTLDISFDISFIPNHTIYFGYILRLVSDDKQNIDLVYDNQGDNKHFKIIIGDRLSKISFNIAETDLYQNWNKIQLKINYQDNRLLVTAGKQVFSEILPQLKPAANYKLLFGANTFGRYQTTDVPPMELRDIAVSENSKLVSNWPLNEWSGDVANETLNYNNGVIANPIWIKARHRYWQKEKEFVMQGDASLAFNPAKEEVYVITPDSLVVFSPNKNQQLRKKAYASGRQLLTPGDQALYINGKLFYLYLDQLALGTFDTVTNRWDKGFRTLETNNGHFNKFYSKMDSSIYAIGGYGQLAYKDSVRRFNFNTHTWQKVKAAGDVFTPRYLAGLGTNATGDTAYIVGGFGSSSGQQIINPRNIYDMMRFTVKDKTFKKMFSITPGKEDFVFANSLVIPPGSHNYYGLIFPQHKFQSRLQMIRGSLNGPDYEIVGNQIPFQFHDASSFADLCYFPQSGKFFAVTLFLENNETHIKIYSLLGPPEPISTTVSTKTRATNWIWIFAGSCAALVILMGYLFVRRKRQPASAEPGVTATEAPIVFASQESSQETTIVEEDKAAVTVQPINRNAIFLFGDFQLFASDGSEITRHFTPLLKELFLLILLNSNKNSRGISSDKLNDILWFDKSEQSARNNRSVNIAKLKTLLDKMDGCHLLKDSDHWKIEADLNQITIDYHNYLLIVSQKRNINKQKINQLREITQRGNFLPGSEYEWLDPLKSELYEEITNTYLQFAKLINITDDPELVIKIANDIFCFDQVNEDAMIMKCRALSLIGKHSLAKLTHETFCKEYKAIYGETFMRDFHSIVEQNAVK